MITRVAFFSLVSEKKKRKFYRSKIIEGARTMSGIAILLAIIALIGFYLNSVWVMVEESGLLPTLFTYVFLCFILLLIFPTGGIYIFVYLLIVVIYIVLRNIVEFIGIENIIGLIFFGLFIAFFV